MELLFTTFVPVQLKYRNQTLITMNYKTLTPATGKSVTQTVVTLFGTGNRMVVDRQPKYKRVNMTDKDED